MLEVPEYALYEVKQITSYSNVFLIYSPWVNEILMDHKIGLFLLCFTPDILRFTSRGRGGSVSMRSRCWCSSAGITTTGRAGRLASDWSILPKLPSHWSILSLLSSHCLLLGRFLLRRIDEASLIPRATQEDSSFKRKLSKREKKELKKQEKKEKVKDGKHDESMADKLYTGRRTRPWGGF